MTPPAPTAGLAAAPPIDGHDADAAWIADLTDDGPAGQAAIARVRDTLLKATRHQVWRLRHLMPGVGAGDLEDLAQQAADDALLAVLGKVETFEGRSRFTTWVYKFGVLHAGVMVRRQAWRQREVPWSDTFVPTDTAPSPPAVSEATELARALETAIATVLTPHQRRVLLALVVQEVPIDVLAERLGTNRNALYKNLHDARHRLRAALIASGDLDDRPTRSTR